MPSSRLQAMLSVVALAPAATITVPHLLQLNGIGVDPTRIEPDRGTGIVVQSADETEITFRNDGAAAATANFLAQFDHTVQQANGGTPIALWYQGGGSGGGGVTDPYTPPDGSFDILSGSVRVTRDALGGAATTEGYTVRNTTAAAAGAQQVSPLLMLTGQGFATGPAASQAVDGAMRLTPVQGVANPRMTLDFLLQVNGAGFVKTAEVSDLGIGAPSDAAGAKGIYWIDDPLTGFTNEAVGMMRVYVNSFIPMTWELVGATGQTIINIGSLALPAIGFANNKDTGLFSITSGNIDFATDGVQNARMSIAAGNPQLLMPNAGLSGSPRYSFIGQTNLGIFAPATDKLGVAVGGTLIWSAQIAAGNQQILHPDGSTAATPGITFSGDLDTGLRRSAADTMHVCTNGTDKISIDATVSLGNTALLVAVAGSAPTRVSVGANDSGGLGFRYLRVPN